MIFTQRDRIVLVKHDLEELLALPADDRLGWGSISTVATAPVEPSS